MRIDIITVLPELLKSPFEASILKRAIDADLVEVHFHNLRDYTTDNYKSIDDTQFGGGAGMVMMVEPIDKCISTLQAARDYDEVIYMTPDGETLKQGIANQLSLKENIIILCGHYKGVDQRVRDHFITREISIGDYVLGGGEVASLVMIEEITRLIPGVLGNPESLAEESHNEEGYLEYPNFTKPSVWRELEVPPVLLSGNHGEIAKWRAAQAAERAKKNL